jgi:two-component system, OmpR family, alkaline phosphatase synthesis response regulator PhoP
MEKRILLIEDEPSLVLTLGDRLRSEGYAVDTSENGIEGYSRAIEGGFDLIVLDLMLPGKGGLDLCRDLRQRGITTPVLMLTARSQVIDKVIGLKLGADDYLTKPFEMLELLARVEALLRRPADARLEADFFQSGALRVDFRSTTVWRNGDVVQLSAREFKLLRYFIEHRGETLSREELLKKVWDYQKAPNTRTVDVHVAWLRQKLEEDPRNPQLILTIQGLGYRFDG